jgi:gamma-glutamylcyclotransferase (GGCT)/AIG2-like uncharacterized protein YtfP
MKRRCPNHRIIGKGILRGYRWIISKRGYANIVRSESDEVQGVIYEISETDEACLDGHEGVRNGAYRKEMMAVEAEGQLLDCLVYVDFVEEECTPREEYIDRLNKGFSDSNLPLEYIDCYIRKFIPA